MSVQRKARRRAIRKDQKARMEQREISLTNNDILLAEQGLSTLRSMDLPTVAAFRVAANLRTIKAASEAYREFRETLIEGKVQLDERGGYVPDAAGELTFKNAEYRKEARQSLKELGEAEVTVKVWTGLTVTDLFGEGKEGKIRPFVFETLWWMFEEM